jgi:hypothetical protein
VSHPSFSPAAEAFLEGDVDLMPGALDKGELELMVEELISRRDSARLLRLGRSADKKVAKAARRGLHLLKTRGAKVEEVRREYHVRGPYADEAELTSLGSIIDGRGERVVWLARHAPDGPGVHFYQAELSESRGLLQFVAGALARRDWRHHVHESLANPRVLVAELPATHVRWLLEEAYEQTTASGHAVPAEFARARLGLGPVLRPGRHPVYEMVALLPLEQARPTLAALHERPEVASWIPPEEALKKLDMEIGQMVTSRLVVAPSERAAQLGRVLGAAATELLSHAERGRLARRLEETAYLVARRGDLEVARRLLAAAVLTRDESIRGEDNPFVLQLFTKLVSPQKLGALEEGSESSIISPKLIV